VSHDRKLFVHRERYAGSRIDTLDFPRARADAENRLTLGARSRIIVVLWHAH
jgi:hypothetical protein